MRHLLRLNDDVEAVEVFYLGLALNTSAGSEMAVMDEISRM